MSHGSDQFPDRVGAIGRCYRELGSVAPYLALAHRPGWPPAARRRVNVSR